MRALLVSIIAVAAMVFAGGLRQEANASTWLAMSVTGDLANASSGLIVKVKKKNKHDHGGNDQKHDDDNQGDESSGQSQDGDSSSAPPDGDASELTTCTIESSGGSGCKTGFKHVCEKMNSGKKCCGCVVDKNAEPANQPPAQRAEFICNSGYETGIQLSATNETDARNNYVDTLKARTPPLTPKGPVTCTKVQ
jgi:hypothetical protein